MSRIGKLPITVPSGVEVTISGRDVTVTGPKGTLHQTLPSPISAGWDEDGRLIVTRPDEEQDSRARHGLARALLANMVTGVSEGFTRTLEIVGVGYRVQAKGDNLEFSLGYSHPIVLEPPEGVDFNVESPTRLTVSGIDKQRVGEVAANIRKLRRPEPYKGKGVRYEGEQIRRKVGKAGK